MYSTWFSVDPRGYCDRSFREGCASGLYRLGADSDECCEDAAVRLPIDDVLLDLELGFEVRSVSKFMGGCVAREFDICEVEREDGNDDRDARV